MISANFTVRHKIELGADTLASQAIIRHKLTRIDTKKGK